MITPTQAPPDWWMEHAGFFGRRYMEGDNSIEGYRDTPQHLNERTSIEASGVQHLLQLQPGAQLLDCPCGYGRHSIELARRGLEVVGVDINGEELAVARANGAPHANLRFMQQDMRALDFDGTFDAVINMFYSFGFFATDAENRAVLDRFYRALKPGGKFLMHTDVHIPRIAAGRYKMHEERQLHTGNKLRIIDSYDAERKRIEGSWMLLHADGQQEELTPYSVRVYTFDEFASWCRDAGFRSVAGYGDWDGAQLTDSAEDMMVVATK